MRLKWEFKGPTPSVVFDRDLLIVGVYGPSLVLGLKRSNGNLVWSTKLDQHPASVVTMSGTYFIFRSHL